MEDDNLISSFQSQIESLHSRIKELEAENAKLASQIARCNCAKIFETVGASVGNDFAAVVENSKNLNGKCGKSRKQRSQDRNWLMLQHYPKRYVALKVMYFGQRFYGFASEAQMEPTVEAELFKAFEKTRLLIGDRKCSQYSRCGRTDKGVSAAGQVVALYLRSKIKPDTSSAGVVFEEHYEDEFDYMKMLNKVLPKDIRIIGWTPVPEDFHARVPLDIDIMVLEKDEL